MKDIYRNTLENDKVIALVKKMYQAMNTPGNPYTSLEVLEIEIQRIYQEGYKEGFECGVDAVNRELKNQVNRFEDPSKKNLNTMWAIEFRNGSFFQNLKSDRGVSIEKAMKFSSKEEAEAFMDKHNWIYFNGGMALEVQNKTP